MSRTVVSFGVLLLALVLARPGSGYSEDRSYDRIRRGQYLVDAGDCIACHTAETGKPFAGGRRIETPFGIIYSANITPDRETGIGAWSEDDLYRAMHSGISVRRGRLYPAFPYPYFTRMSRDDVSAVYSYLATLEPIRNRPPQNELMWPLNYRFFMLPWDWLFFRAGTFQHNPQKSDEWNRGAYLVQGPGHCGACHTPKNFLAADESSDALQGGQVQNWFAPKLANDSRNGLGTWSVEDITEYLKTGRNNHSGAAAIMSEVVEHSTSKLAEPDLHAIAVYLKDVPGKASSPSKPAQAALDAGRMIFADSCAGCHQANGQGVERMFPPLVHNANVQSDDPTTIIRVILRGARTVATNARPTPFAMPAYGWKLGDEEIAAVATYVRNSWGNSASPVSSDQVKTLRDRLRAAVE